MERCISSSSNLPPDAFEDNNTIATAHGLGTITGTFTQAIFGNVGFNNGPGDTRDTADYYGFTVSPGQVVSGTVSLTGLCDDIDVLIQGPNNTHIANVSSQNNDETVTITNLTPGNYVIKVFTKLPTMKSTYNLDVQLTSIPTPTPPKDTFEAEGATPNNDTMLAASVIGVINNSAVQTISNANIGFFNGDGATHDVADFYKFTVEPGQVANGTITLEGLSDDADLELLGPGNTQFSNVNSSIIGEVITVSNLVEGDYFIKVFTKNVNLATGYNVILDLTKTSALGADTFEQHGSFTDNNSIQSAFDLGSVNSLSQVIAGNVGFLNGIGSTLDSADYYRFTVDSGTTVSGTVSLTGLSDDIDVIIQGPNNTHIANVRPQDNDETLTISNLVPGQYVIKVFPKLPSSRSAYNLSVNLDRDTVIN